MGFSSKLASLFVEFVLKGQAEMKAALEANKAGLDHIKTSATALGELVNSTMTRATTAMRVFALSGGDSQKSIDKLGLAVKSTETALGNAKAAARAFAEESKAKMLQAAQAVTDLQGRQRELINLHKATISGNLQAGISTGALKQQRADIAELSKGIAQAQAGVKLFADQHKQGMAYAQNNVLTLAEKLKQLRDTQLDAQKKLNAKGFWQWPIEGAEKVTTLKTVVTGFAEKARTAFLGLTGTVTGFVTAGLATSNMGQLLSFRMGELSRTIAGLFRPEIESVIKSIQRFTNWIRGLSDAQKENIVFWVKFTATVLFVVAIVPRVVAAIQLVVNAYKALTAIQIIQQATSGGAKAWAGIIAGAALAAAAIGLVTKMTMDFDKAQAGTKGRGALASASPGVMSPNDIYAQVASLSVNVGMKTEAKIAQDQRAETNRRLGTIQDELAKRSTGPIKFW